MNLLNLKTLRRIINIEHAYEKKVSEIWQSTELKVVVYTKMECYTAGLSIKNENVEPKALVH